MKENSLLFINPELARKLLAHYLCPLGLSHKKVVPAVIKTLSPTLLRRFLRSAIDGDGHKAGIGEVYSTTSPILADDVQEIALKAGFRSTLYVENRAGNRRTIKNHSFIANYNIYRVGINRPANIWYPQPDIVPYDGNIVCVTLAEHNNIFVRRNGRAIWSGNCWPPVSEFWCYYLSKEWRATQAPHTDSQYLVDGFNCDFEATWGYSIHPQFLTRNLEVQQFAFQWYKEAVQDIIITITKK